MYLYSYEYFRIYRNWCIKCNKTEVLNLGDMNFPATDTVDWSLYRKFNDVAVPFYGKLVMSEEKTNVCTWRKNKW